jgi:dTMP kinase
MTRGSRLERGGRLITVEGIEGAGKSTQVARLAAWLRDQGFPVETTSEPDGTALGIEIRHLLGRMRSLDPLAECHLFAASRAEHVRTRIRPWLDAGAIVLCDRYTDSTLAYQGHGRGVPLEVVTTLNRLTTDGLMPDLTILLDLDPAEGLRRARSRQPGLSNSLRGDMQPDPFEGLGIEFHERVRKGYRLIAEREPGRVEVVDAAGAADAVTARIRTVVAARLGLGEEAR